MKILEKTICTLSDIAKWIGMAVIMIMMLITTVSVVFRYLGITFIGAVEIVQLTLVTAIMFGLAYTHRENGHISIGLLVDHFPMKIQYVFDIIANVLTLFVCLLFSWFFFQAGMKEVTGIVTKTDLLAIPKYPFKFVISIGLLLWGLEAILKIVVSVINFGKNSPTNLQASKELDEI